MGKHTWTAKVCSHTTGETGTASGEVENPGPGFNRQQMTDDVAEHVRDQARLQGHVATPYDIEIL